MRSSLPQIVATAYISLALTLWYIAPDESRYVFSDNSRCLLFNICATPEPKTAMPHSPEDVAANALSVKLAGAAC